MSDTLLAGSIGRLAAASSVTGATDKIPVYQNGIVNYATPDQIALGPDAVVGPASATDNAAVVFDGTTGELVKNSTVIHSTTTNTFNDGATDIDFIVKKNTSGNAINYDAGTSTLSLDATFLFLAGAVALIGTLSQTGSTTYTQPSAGIILKQGANGRVGTTVLTAGASTVSNTSVAVTDIISLSLNTVGGTIASQPYVATITAGVGFTVEGGGGSNTSTYNYSIVKSAA